MYNFSGIIKLKGNINKHIDPDFIKNMLNRVNKNSTKSLLQDNICLQVESSTNTDTPVFFGKVKIVLSGIIFNTKELKTILGLSVEKEECVENLIAQLYLKKGLDFASILNGQFIIIVLDIEKNDIHIVRDHMGTASLYYYISNDKIIFGSQIKIVLAHPEVHSKFNWNKGLSLAWAKSDSSNETMFESIKFLKEGSIMTCNQISGEIFENCFWDINTSQNEKESDKRSVLEIVDGYKNIVQDSIQIRSEYFEKNYLFFSGGIDSSIIGKICSQKNEVESYTAISGLSLLNGDFQNCFDFASRYKFQNHYILFNEGGFQNVTGDDWKNILWNCESPFLDVVLVLKYFSHRYLSETTSLNNNFVFTGLGSDEYNGGDARNGFSHSGFDSSNYWNLFYQKLQKKKFDSYISEKNYGLALHYPYINKSYMASETNKLNELDSWLFYLKSNKHVFNLRSLAPENKIAKAYNNHNIYPFLDYRIIDFISKIPSKFYSELFFDKKILRTAFNDDVGKNIANNPKVTYFPYVKPNATYSFYSDLFTKSNNLLIKEALGDIDSKHDVINIKNIYSAINRAKIDRNSSVINNLLPILNCGLLERILSSDTYKNSHISYKPEVIKINKQEELDIYISSKLNPKKIQLIDMEIGFAENSFLLKNENNKIYYLCKNYELEYEIEETSIEWLKFLTSIEKKSNIIRKVLKDQEIKIETIEPFLKTAIDSGILIIK